MPVIFSPNRKDTQIYTYARFARDLQPSFTLTDTFGFSFLPRVYLTPRQALPPNESETLHHSIQ